MTDLHQKHGGEWEHIDSYRTYLVWKNAHITNERKFLAWVRVSIALVTLGFIVQRFDIFLNSMVGTNFKGRLDEVHHVYEQIPLVFFILGAVIIAVATVEFFVDRRRINKSAKNTSIVLDVLIICLLVFIVIVIGAFIAF